MKRWTLRICLLVILLTLPLGAFSLVRTSAAAETVVPAYGAPAYVDGSPVGGGTGYSQIYSAADSHHIASTAAQLKAALAAASSGDIVYVADGTTITIDSTNWYGKNSSGIGTGCYLKAGVTLAGGRGRAGVTGGIIKVASTLQPTVFSVLIWCADSSCRVTGLTLVGAQEGTTGGNMWCGIWTGDNAEVDNNEIHGFGYGGVRVDRDRTDVWIHHNYIHHNRQSGYGYGVCVNAYNIDHTSSAVVEGNKFDYARHVISGSRGRSSYIFRYNYLGANCTNTQIDVHGQNAGGEYLAKDGSEYIFCAGYSIKIYNNTSICTSNPLVGIRGIPYSTGSISVLNNWTYTTATQEWQLSSDRPKVRTINQQMDNIPGYGYQAPSKGAFVRMTARDNWYGTTAPPGDSPSAVNQPPATPGAPGGGTTSGGTGTSYTYWMHTTDPDGDTIVYTINWGDETSSTTDAKNSGKYAYAGHAWAKPGTYAVKVQATDSKGNASAWSPSRSVTIASALTTNQTPVTPASPEVQPELPTPVTPAAPEVQPELPTPEPPAPAPIIPAPATSEPSTPAAAPAQGTSAAVTPSVETPIESSPVGPSTATVENAGGSLSPAVGGSSAGGPQRSGFAWWLFGVSVIVGGAVLLTGAIVRDATSEPPGW